MYTQREKRNVEQICYEEAHVQKVLSEIRKNFEGYFRRFIETEGGIGVTERESHKKHTYFGVHSKKKCRIPESSSEKYIRRIRESIEEFEKDRQPYIELFNEKVLEEYEEDASTFKSVVLKRRCPIIRKTYENKRVKELDKYRFAFNVADADYLLRVVTNLCKFESFYAENIYSAPSYDEKSKYQELQLSLLDTEDYTAFGVIGGGIKSMMLYKVNPMMFPYRSRNALWALWFLTDKNPFECKMDSEFLMIDTKSFTMQQNYYYPYELFAFYAFEIYKMLRDKADEMKAYIDPNYRYVIVESFLNYVADEHGAEIDFYLSQNKDSNRCSA